MFPDFVKQVIEADNECYFSTAISDVITCCKDGMFDFNGIAMHTCKHYPCDKIININKKFGITL